MSGFTLRWSELTKEWRSRPPTDLSNNYTYLKPGKTKKDLRCVDYFVGQEELMKYLVQVDLEAAKDSLSGVSSAAVRASPAAGLKGSFMPNVAQLRLSSSLMSIAAGPNESLNFTRSRKSSSRSQIKTSVL
ncbi:hypothetical protein DVH05_006139 [Phytophthora capsici]|nr:hypothetical protein DVH05_006139 [Phytophthora capsici]